MKKGRWWPTWCLNQGQASMGDQMNLNPINYLRSSKIRASPPLRKICNSQQVFGPPPGHNFARKDLRINTRRRQPRCGKHPPARAGRMGTQRWPVTGGGLDIHSRWVNPRKKSLQKDKLSALEEKEIHSAPRVKDQMDHPV